ncbi:hypothetical protein LAh8_1 [Aeromonas phage LAh_8]|uniref:Amidoligase enzyme n=2 Tax=Lahexavirus TaxID=2843411 RepID=A0A514A0C8_9CAUD|nr:hypothetical protein HWC31_gp001 [Aeromonas phage LAh_8]QDH46729.1 hypothetical protein LAh8_1 [Aeromonas phage LAh_8]
MRLFKLDWGFKMPITPPNGRMSLSEILRASNQVLGTSRADRQDFGTIARVVNEPLWFQDDWRDMGLRPDEPPPSPPPPPAPQPEEDVDAAVEGPHDDSESFGFDGEVSWEGVEARAAEGISLRRTSPTPAFEVQFNNSLASSMQTLAAGGIRRARPVRGNPVQEQTFDSEEEFEMRTVGSIVGREPDVSTVTPHQLVLGINRVGVEIEVERFNNRRARLRYWNLVSDGSLRNNGQEFTFRGALGGKDAFDAISEIDTLLYQANPELNIRCSTHVHVDVRDMTVPQLKRMILAYAFYESFLFNQSGRHRMKSNFCMPLCIAEGLTHILMDYWGNTDADFIFNVTDRWDKYSAINLIPIRSYGSVEFRIAEGKSKSGQLLRLVNRFLALKEIAVEKDMSDREFLDFLRETDYRMIFRKGIRRQVAFTEEDIQTGWIIANDIATLGKMR